MGPEEKLGVEGTGPGKLIGVLDSQRGVQPPQGKYRAIASFPRAADQPSSSLPSSTVPSLRALDGLRCP